MCDTGVYGSMCVCVLFAPLFGATLGVCERVCVCVCVCVDGLYLAMCSRAVCILRVCRACECEHVWGRRVTLLCVWKPVCMCLTVFHCDAVYGAACVYVCAPPCDTLFTCVHLCVACSRCCIPCGCVLTQCLRRVRSVCVWGRCLTQCATHCLRVYRWVVQWAPAFTLFHFVRLCVCVGGACG